ncbi:DMT family transporter [Peribacillus kribbensis]|uniref:DMT family transporter n=1 Tax=Peribacillus kribbensis TaxID=356658 RepID=UPI0009D71491|nr:EamA family transporter [Peribacillus kribbensis]
MVLLGASFWGVSGTAAQYLFQKQGFSPEWLTVMRLLISGVLLLGIAYKKEKNLLWGIWKNKTDRISILLFGILGMLAVQYTYFAAIKEGNAATATVLQYLAPALITCYAAIRARSLPSKTVAVSVIFAILGTFLLVTGGQIHTLSISGWAVFWGITSAFALAFYTLQPKKLLLKWGSALVVGWGMLIGGIFFSLIHPPWRFSGQWSLSSLAAVAFVILFGTILAFYFYLESTKYISATEVSLLASAEPLSATFISIVWLQVPFGLAEWIGTLCIVGTITILSIVKAEKK